MSNFRTLTLAGVATMLGLSSAHAAFMQVTTLPDATPFTFNDAVGTVYTMPAVYPAATFSTSAGNVLERNQANTSYLDSNFANNTQLIAQCGFTGLGSCAPGGATTITFAQPVTGFSISADDFDTTQLYTFSLQAFGGAALLGTITASSLADNGAAPAILAAMSTTPITSVRITGTAASAPDGDFVLGNITLAGTAVPEPASILVLSASLLLLGRARQRM